MDRELLKLTRDRKEITVRYEKQTQAIWVYIKPKDCPCLSAELLEEYHEVQQELIDYFIRSNMKPKTPIKFFVAASQTPEIYGFGGNVLEIIETIRSRKRERIERCANVAIKNMYLHVVNLHLPIQTVTLVEGAAFGGGFETALPFNYIIAEKQSQFGLQQMRFNFFPGSGIYSLLARKVGMKNADEIILGMKTYSAQEMMEFGAVDAVAKKGEGKKAVDAYLKRYLRNFSSLQALHAAKMRYRPFEFSELEDMAKIWVDSLMNLEGKDIKMMEKVAEKQKESLYDIPHLLRAKQDRRIIPDVEFPLTDMDGNLIEKDRRHLPDPRNND